MGCDANNPAATEASKGALLSGTHISVESTLVTRSCCRVKRRIIVTDTVSVHYFCFTIFDLDRCFTERYSQTRADTGVVREGCHRVKIKLILLWGSLEHAKIIFQNKIELSSFSKRASLLLCLAFALCCNIVSPDHKLTSKPAWRLSHIRRTSLSFNKQASNTLKDSKAFWLKEFGEWRQRGGDLYTRSVTSPCSNMFAAWNGKGMTSAELSCPELPGLAWYLPET